MESISRTISHIILADDDDDDLLLFKEAITKVRSSIEVSLADDGQKLLHYINNLQVPDIIFLDLNMPRKNGLECLQEIRKDRKFDDVPVIIYSTSKSNRDIEACYYSGASYYLVKPYSFEEMLEMLTYLFSQLATSFSERPVRENFVLTS